MDKWENFLKETIGKEYHEPTESKLKLNRYKHTKAEKADKGADNDNKIEL